MARFGRDDCCCERIIDALTQDGDEPNCFAIVGMYCYQTEGSDQEVETIPDNLWTQVVSNLITQYQQILTGGDVVTFTYEHLTPPGGGNIQATNNTAFTAASIDDFRLTWDQPLIGQFTLLLEDIGPGTLFNIVPAPDTINPAFGVGGTHQLIWNDITGINQIDINADATNPGADVMRLSVDESVSLTHVTFVPADTIRVLAFSNNCVDPPTIRYINVLTAEEITDPDIISIVTDCDIDVSEEEVCVTIDEETFTCIKRTFMASDPVDIFIGPDGTLVSPDSWVPGQCDFEIVTGYVFDCLRFDNNLPINSDATFNADPVGTNEIIFEAADVALLVRNEIEKAQQVQAQETLHGESITPVVIVTDSGETYSFNPAALQAGTGSTLVIDESDIIAWGTNQTDLVTELQYSIFDSCDCKAVEVLQWIKDSDEVYLIDVFDITYNQETGQKISLLDENRLLDFLQLGPFAGPCPEAEQVMEVNPLCCNDDLLTGSPEIATERLAWADGSDSSLMYDGGVPIVPTTGNDVDEVRDKLQPGVAPSFVVPANVGFDVLATAPTFVEDGLNERSVLNFDSGDNDRLRLDTNNPPNGPFTLFYLVSASDLVLASQACILAVGPDNSDGDEYNLDDGAWQLSRDGIFPSFIFRMTGPSVPAGPPGTDPLMLVQTGPYSPETSPSDGATGVNNTYQLERAIATEAEFFNGQFHLITVSYDDVSQILSAYFDGELRLQMDMSVMVPQFQMGSDYFRVFGNRNGAAYLSGQLAEMFFADSYLSPEETAEVNSYLICKWGIDPSLVAGGLGDLELDPQGSYTAPSPFVQIIQADGSIIYRNTLNGQTFALPPTPGLALCLDESEDAIQPVEIDTSCDEPMFVQPTIIPEGRVCYIAIEAQTLEIDFQNYEWVRVNSTDANLTIPLPDGTEIIFSLNRISGTGVIEAIPHPGCASEAQIRIGDTGTPPKLSRYRLSWNRTLKAEPFIMGICDIDPSENPPVIVNVVPDSIGPTGNNIYTHYTFNDGSLLNPSAGIVFDLDLFIYGAGVAGTINVDSDRVLGEAFATVDCNGNKVYRDVVTNEILVDPTLIECPKVSWSEILCDDDCVTFNRVYHKTLAGEVTYQDLSLLGQPYSPVGLVDICYPCPCTAKSILIELGDGETWTPAALPANHVVTGISINTIIEAADSSITDADATVVTNIPAGLSMSWSASQDYNTLEPPQSVFAGTGGRMIINMTLRDDSP